MDAITNLAGGRVKKEEFKDLCELSEQVYGYKYAWKKLRSVKGKPRFTRINRGLIFAQRQIGNRSMEARCMPLTNAGIKQFMLATLESRKQMEVSKND